VSSRSPLLLALDTSTSTASVALFDGQRVISETTWLAGREHSTRLLIEVESALARVGQTQAELSGLVVAHGPGSFTGVRVALSVAKGIAAGLSIPAWGVSSLEVLAHAAEAHGAGAAEHLATGTAEHLASGTAGHLASGAAGDGELPVRAVVEAGRQRYATALFSGGHCAAAPRLATLDQLVELLTQPTLVIGELSSEARTRLAHHPPARLASPAACLRRAGFLAELGWRLAEAGDAGDPNALDAVYVS
jgi:tRNA threonylcarbamoyladenosine biosynthesis protein TsaB